MKFLVILMLIFLPFTSYANNNLVTQCIGMSKIAKLVTTAKLEGVSVSELIEDMNDNVTLAEFVVKVYPVYNDPDEAEIEMLKWCLENVNP